MIIESDYKYFLLQPVNTTTRSVKFVSDHEAGECEVYFRVLVHDALILGVVDSPDTDSQSKPVVV